MIGVTTRFVGLALAGSLGLSGWPVTAVAGICASEVISARGEPARFRTVARIKALGNWRSRVRRHTGLGAAYDNWALAIDQVERCVDNETSVACTVSAKPCRP